MTKLTTKSRQLSFAANALHHRADRNIFVTEPTSGTTARSRGNLYVVTETDSDSAIDRAFCRLIAEHVRNEYYKDTARAPTAALQSALTIAARKIHDDERNPDDAARPVAGLTCVVVCDGNVTVAYSLPVQVFLRSGPHLTLVPDPPPWEGEIESYSAARFVGFQHRLEFDVVEAQLAEGELLLVCSSSLAQRLSRQRVERMLARRDVGGLAQDLRGLYGDAETPAYGLIVQVVPDHREDMAADRPSPPEDQLADLWGRFRPNGSGKPAAATARSGPFAGAGSAVLERAGALDANGGPSPVAAGRAGRVTSLPQSQPLPPLKAPEREPYRGRLTSRGSRRDSGADGVAWLALVQSKVTLAVVVAVLLVVAALGAARLVRAIHARQQHEAAQRIVASINQQVNTADQTSDAPAKLKQLQKALQTTKDNQAAIAPSEYTTLSTTIQGKMDQVEQLAHFGGVATVGDFSSQKQLTFSRVLVDGDVVYALDQGNHRVAVLTLTDPKPAFPIAPGTKAGTDVVGNVTAMALSPVGLFALDDRHVLWQYDKVKKDLARIKVAGSDNWQEPRSIATQGDKLLVLDAKQDRIFQYTMTGISFGPATDYLAPAPAGQEPDLAHSVDMAADATSVFVLQADGTVLKFTKGERGQFPESGLAENIVSPSSIFANGRDAAVYVSDPSNRRVVKLAKDGRFLQQIKLPDDQDKLGTVQAIYVDEAQNRAVLATEASLATASMSSP